MGRDTPISPDDVLTIQHPTLRQDVPVGSDTWLAWLSDERTTSFRFSIADERFTARREHKPGGWYWYAYRRHAGRLRKVYLGRGVDLTLERLMRAATALIADPPPTT